MQHLDAYPTLKKALPASRQGRSLASALIVLWMIAQPEGRKIAE
jgi:hypothetical protein